MRGDACHVSLVKLLINPANWSANPLEQVRVEDIEKKSPFYNSLHFSPVSGLLHYTYVTAHTIFIYIYMYISLLKVHVPRRLWGGAYERLVAH